MNRALIIGVVAVVILVGGFFLLNNYIYQEKQPETGFQVGYKDIAYTIQGKAIDLEDGVAEADGVRTSYFGNEVEGDLSEDGISDIAFILTQETGTSTSYYLVAAIQTEGGYRGTSGALLGENIEPVGLAPELGGIRATYRIPSGLQATTTATTTNTREASRLFVVANGEFVESDL